ncbi:MAG: ABC transporter permease [Terracidiphilus sp.]
MAIWREITYGLKGLLRRRERDQDLADELDQYYEDSEAEGRARGLSPEEARRTARLEAGSATAARDQASSYGWENLVSGFLADARFALRQLRRHPAFTVTAALTLALGIGANTAIFTVVESVLLAPLPYRNAASIGVLQTHWADNGRTSISGHTSLRITGPDAVDIREQARSFAAVSLYSGGNEGVQLRDHAVYTTVTWVDAGFARVFQLEPIAGRLFTGEEAHRAALVSEQFARDNYGSAQAALGQVIHVEGEAIEITGVLPGWFDFPARTQVWEAAPLRPESMVRSAFNYKAVARLQPGAAIGSAASELNTLSGRLQLAYPGDNRDKQFLFVPLQKALTGDARPTLLLLWATAGLILLIACVNVTHLQLVRSLEQQREIAIRKALGSSGWKVVRPVILESILVALIGGVAGVLIALPALRVLLALAPRELPRAAEIHLNAWVLGFTLGLSLLTALIASLLPALRSAAVDPAESLKSDASRGMGRKGAASLRDGLVVAEVTATFVLAMGAGLLLHTMSNLMARDMGYDTQQLLVADADVPAHSLDEAKEATRQLGQIFANLGALPGIERVAGIMGLPTGAYGSNGYYSTRGGVPVDPHNPPSANFSVSSPGYFQTMAISIQRGRDFTAQDGYDAPFVAVISESLARQSFGNADPVGKQIQCGLDSDKWMTVVGVVGDVRQDSPADVPGPTLYMPMAQHPFYANQIHIVMRTGVTPLSLMNSAQSAILKVNPLVALRFTTMDEMVAKSVAAERFRAVLISSFAGVGLLLAMLGIYGTIAYSVAQRTFEIGLRMAFGAQRGAILRSVMWHAVRLALCGIAAGLVLSLALTRLVTSMLVGVHPADPASLAAAAAVILLTALAAGFGPGWKGTRIEPMRALRTE